LIEELQNLKIVEFDAHDEESMSRLMTTETIQDRNQSWSQNWKPNQIARVEAKS
jgi:hypothetical protein